MTTTPISAQEKRRRLFAVNQVLNLLRSKGYQPSTAMQAAYNRYINGEIEWEACKNLVKQIGLQESKQRQQGAS